MEVVINSCYGGFGLSHEAVMLYAKYSGFKLYPFVDGRDENGKITFGTHVPYVGQENTWLIHYSKKQLKNGKYAKSSYFSERDIQRTDPILLKVVKELGEKANGNHAQLRIVEVPDDAQWEISEYDGNEHIAETHRTWY